MFLAEIRSNPRGWLIVAVTFLALSLAFLARNTFGMLIPEWEAEFGWTRQFLSTGAAVVLLVMGSVAPFVGYLLDRIGPRYLFGGGLALCGLALAATATMTEPWQFFAVYCVVAALGYGVIGIPLATTAIALSFERNRGLATSIGTSGVGAGAAILLPLFAAVMATISWRPTLVAFGLAIAVLGILGMPLVDNAAGRAHARAGGGGRITTLGEKLRLLFRSRTFWLLAGSYAICGFTTAGVVRVHLIPYAASSGFPPITSATAFGVMAAFDMVGMVLAGYLTDRVNRPALLGGIYFLRALTFILLMFIAADISLLFLFAMLFGTLDFATVPPQASLVASHIGLRSMGMTMGILFAGHSAGAAIGAFMAGWLFDRFALYDWVWIISIGLALLASALAFSIRETPAAEPAPA